MKISKKELKKFDKEFDGLKPEERIISLSEVKEELDEIINKIESLEDKISEQMDELEVVNECDDNSCNCDDNVDQSELYELYSELEDRVLSKDFYRALRTIS